MFILFVWEGASRPWTVGVVTTTYTLNSSPQSQLANDWVESWVQPIGLRPWTPMHMPNIYPSFTSVRGCACECFTPLKHGLIGKLSQALNC